MSPRPRTVSEVVLALGGLIFLLASCTDDAAVETGPAEPAGDATESNITVDREIDGDSLELRIDGQVTEVRLLGINAPESADCQGPAATDALGTLLGAGPIRVDGSETDRFGRLLVRLEVDGVSVNETMVAQGWALAIHGDGDDYVDEMQRAAEAGLGLWSPDASGCTPVAGDLEITDAEPDPPGPDDQAMTSEFVEITNTGAATVDLTDWILRDESTGNRFTFGPASIDPGRSLRVVTGCGTDDDETIHWCSGNPVWSNRGETALLLGPDGTYVAHRFL